MHKQVAEDLALRAKPPRHPWRLSLSWLSSKVFMALVLFAGAVFLGVMSLVLKDAGSFKHRKPEFPALPQLNAAIAQAQERLKVDPQDIATLVELGTLHFEKGKEFYPEAINELEEARDFGALDPRIFYCLGIMYQEVGLYSFALQEYKRFLRHYPDDKEIRMLTAKLLYKQGSYPEAVSEYERLKYYFPGDALIEENLGLSLWGARFADRAAETFRALAASGGGQAKRAEFYLGQIAFEGGDFGASLQHFLRCQPQGAEDFGLAALQLRSALAQAYQKLGRWPEAKTAWEAVLSLDPNEAKAKAAFKELNRRLPAKKPSEAGKP